MINPCVGTKVKVDQPIDILFGDVPITINQEAIGIISGKSDFIAYVDYTICKGIILTIGIKEELLIEVHN
jgi:hypothetical protein